MGYIALGVLVLTLVALLFGALFGLMRGLNRSLLRLGLVLLCVILAVALRGVFVDIILNIETGKGTLQEMLLSTFNSGDMQLPESMINLIFALLEIIVGIVVYFVLFFVFRFITWILFYPILKIFVKKGENKRGGWGALVGLGQGLIIAFAVWAPVSGLLAQSNKLMSFEIEEGKQISEQIPAEIGMTDYSTSAPGVVYNAVGGWYFDILGTTTDDSGKTIRLSDTCDIVVVVMDVMEEAKTLGESMEGLDPENATMQEMTTAIRGLGDALINIDASIDSLNADARAIVNDLVGSIGDLMGEGDDAITLPDDFSLDTIDLGAAGGALNGFATYMEKVEDPESEPVTQDEVDSIVNGLAANMFIFDMFEVEGAMMPIEDPVHKGMFSAAIMATENTTLEQKSTLMTLFGLI